MSIINTAVSAIMASLQSGTPVAPQIARVYLRPLAQAVVQAVVVRPMGSEVTGEAILATGYPVSWTTTVAVECYARSTSITPDIAVDVLIESVYARLMSDPTLGGAVLGLQPQNLSYDFDADGEKTVCVTLVFHIRHRSSGATLS